MAAASVFIAIVGMAMGRERKPKAPKAPEAAESQKGKTA